ncbi:zinc ABC transporter substrate-binding protein ZnuA [Vibrio tubiashii]|uniref:zinc ABC transporter substrate-binding protein ZnuA n=1 Tax=Vibrio tubiashii TaxID=29498 RepID=UPI001EFDB13B|nr:zinc ABC transporter substrate-binding protein ZnuA [Vibrio tubiashii]MCG9583146.1 zinc ABC transporter substrate-binding protein ZnuA [Vibrio tubiashii]MCG9616740.1 zinc ABC transporter substrate-binding protein ZnuA [Vibrio tubiashii]MCG9686815.1 zinc ABC transporter substrate-binding protein ZnuA [Vibrio tubiashii]
MKRFLTACAIVLASTSIAQASTVLTSIKPIQLITVELTKNISQPDVLLGSNTSPHDYALRPSDVKRLRNADLVVWYGNDLEPFLTKVLKDQDNVLTLSDINGLELREFAGGHHDHHDHDGHDHGSHDPHFWLGYKPTMQVAEAITQKLVELDATNKAEYVKNLEAFKQQLTEQKAAITKQLAPVADAGYYVFHDAYGYFEQDFPLNHLGYFTVSPERKPGAKTLISIRKTLAAEQARCVFSEPQFTPAVVESVTRGSNAKTGVLDPLGIDVEAVEGGYFKFKQNLADSFSNCLAR